MSDKMYNIPTSTVNKKAECKPRPPSNVPGSLSAKTSVPSKQGKPTYQSAYSTGVSLNPRKDHIK